MSIILYEFTVKQMIAISDYSFEAYRNIVGSMEIPNGGKDD
jgi:hypothetical protein